MSNRQMVEMISTRLPYGAAATMSNAARELAISRSELLRRAVEAYIARLDGTKNK